MKMGRTCCRHGTDERFKLKFWSKIQKEKMEAARPYFLSGLHPPGNFEKIKYVKKIFIRSPNENF
jgi:hypothetical protein